MHKNIIPVLLLKQKSVHKLNENKTHHSKTNTLFASYEI